MNTLRRTALIVMAAVLIAAIMPCAAFAESIEAADAADLQTSDAGELLVLIWNGTIRMRGTDGTARTIPSGDLISVKPDEYAATIVPNDGYTVGQVLMNGTRLQTTADDSGAVSVAVPKDKGDLVVVCTPQVETKFEIEGDGRVTVTGEDGKPVAVEDGTTYTSDGQGTLTVEVEEAIDSSFAGAAIDGAAIPAEQTAGGWVMSVEERPNGVVHLDFTPSVTVSSVLDNCTLEVLNDEVWIPVAEGTAVLRLSGNLRFSVLPDEGFELDEVLVNGSKTEVCQEEDGRYMFGVESEQGEDLSIAAAALTPNDSISEVDEDTGIRYTLPGRNEAPESNITVGSRLDIEQLQDGERLDRAYTACESLGDVVGAYDIVLEDEGVSYEPTAPVKVSFPVPEELAEKTDDEVAIIRISEGGSLSRVPFVRETVDGTDYLVGTADRFSTFALVRTSKKARAEGVTVQMGDESNLTLFVVLGIVAAAVVILAVLMYLRSRRKSK